MEIEVTCPNCDGDGWVRVGGPSEDMWDWCSQCKSKGRIEVMDTLNDARASSEGMDTPKEWK